MGNPRQHCRIYWQYTREQQQRYNEQTPDMGIRQELKEGHRVSRLILVQFTCNHLNKLKIRVDSKTS